MCRAAAQKVVLDGDCDWLRAGKYAMVIRVWTLLIDPPVAHIFRPRFFPEVTV
jgi:hypothetical protein